MVTRFRGEYEGPTNQDIHGEMSGPWQTDHMQSNLDVSTRTKIGHLPFARQRLNPVIYCWSKFADLEVRQKCWRFWERAMNISGTILFRASPNCHWALRGHILLFPELFSPLIVLIMRSTDCQQTVSNQRETHCSNIAQLLLPLFQWLQQQPCSMLTFVYNVEFRTVNTWLLLFCMRRKQLKTSPSGVHVFVSFTGLPLLFINKHYRLFLLEILLVCSCPNFKSEIVQFGSLPNMTMRLRMVFASGIVNPHTWIHFGPTASKITRTPAIQCIARKWYAWLIVNFCMRSKHMDFRIYIYNVRFLDSSLKTLQPSYQLDHRTGRETR